MDNDLLLQIARKILVAAWIRVLGKLAVALIPAGIHFTYDSDTADKLTGITMLVAAPVLLWLEHKLAGLNLHKVAAAAHSSGVDAGIDAAQRTNEAEAPADPKPSLYPKPLPITPPPTQS